MVLNETIRKIQLGLQKQPPELPYKKKLFLKILHYSQENTFAGVSF